EVLAEARRQDEACAGELNLEQQAVESDLRAWHAEMQALSTTIKPGDDNGPVIGRLADLQERIAAADERVRSIKDQIDIVGHRTLDEQEAATAMSVFDPMWGSLSPQEQMRIVQLLVEQVDYDGAKGKVAIAFRPVGIKTLARELAHKREG